MLAERVRGLAADPARAGRRTLLGHHRSARRGQVDVRGRSWREALRRNGIVAVLVPMDGFHLAQRVLDERGLADVKGAPQTFDGAGYRALLDRLRQNGSDVVYAPEFRREIEEPVAGAIAVAPDVEVVVTEGNYLLLDDEPWAGVRGLLDEVWYLDAGPARCAGTGSPRGTAASAAPTRRPGSARRAATRPTPRWSRPERARADLVVPLGDGAAQAAAQSSMSVAPSTSPSTSTTLTRPSSSA